jgi:hypothetical protein
MIISNSYAPGIESMDMLIGGFTCGIVPGRVDSVSQPQSFTRDGATAPNSLGLGLERVYRDAVIKPLRWFRQHPLRSKPEGDPLTVRYNTDGVAGGLQIITDDVCSLTPGEFVLLFLDEDYLTPAMGLAHLDIRHSALGVFRPQKDGTFKRDRMFIATWKLGDILACIDKYRANEARTAGYLQRVGRGSIAQ